MKRICTVTGAEFEISKAALEFYARMNVPVPTLCPQERQRRRIAHRNFSTLHQRNSDASGKKIISMYSDQVPFPVFEHSEWWKDNWDPRDYGRNFDFSRPFFEQYRQLSAVVPRVALMNAQCENCDYTNFAFNAHNCYLIFGCVHDEDCLYGHIVWESQHCVDNLYVYQCQWCSNSIDLAGCYDVHYSTESVNCRESYFLHDCRNCQNCFGCTNLRNKQYYFLNEPLSRTDYQAQVDNIFPLSYTTVAEMQRWLAEEKIKQTIYPPSFTSQVEEVSGNHVYQSRNAWHCFDTKKAEDASYCFTTFDVNKCFDMSFGSGRNSLEGVAVVESEETIGCHTVVGSYNTAYCEYCYYSHDLLGCIGMKHAEYCIFNKQYSREDYFALSEKIISHMRSSAEWGEFFPIQLSPFAYNQSTASEYLPLARAEAERRSLRWQSESALEHDKPPVSPITLPDRITEVSDSILEKNLCCANSGKQYKIIPAELAFYRRMQLPLPRLCPQERHRGRMRQREPRQLQIRACPRCQSQFISAMAVQDARTVLCEPCYLAEIQ